MFLPKRNEQGFREGMQQSYDDEEVHRSLELNVQEAPFIEDGGVGEQDVCWIPVESDGATSSVPYVICAP